MGTTPKPAIGPAKNAAITPEVSPETNQEFWDRRIRQNPNAMGVGCANVGLQYNQWLYRIRSHRFDRISQKLPFDLQHAQILDVGSGTGFYIGKWLSKGVNNLHGLDFSQTAIDLLETQYPDCEFHLADISAAELPLPFDCYDIITAFDVLFHQVDDQQYLATLKNLARLLKPGGVLVLSENFVHKERPRGGNYHYSRTLKSIETLLQQAGLELESRRPMFVLMNAPDDARGKLAPAWWRMVQRILRQGEWAGWLLGAGLYWPERVLTFMKQESPSTEIAICRLRKRENE